MLVQIHFKYYSSVFYLPDVGVLFSYGVYIYYPLFFSSVSSVCHQPAAQPSVSRSDLVPIPLITSTAVLASQFFSDLVRSFL